MLDVIGALYEPLQIDGENVVRQPVQIPGWHVNSTEVIPEWEEYRVTPTTPHRVFFGHDTVFYAFPNEDVFRESATELGLLDDVEDNAGWSPV